MSVHAQVCLQDLRVSREIFPVFLMKGRLIYDIYIISITYTILFLPFLRSYNEVIDTLTMHHLF